MERSKEYHRKWLEKFLSNMEMIHSAKEEKENFASSFMT
jgi:hypothetical protein